MKIADLLRHKSSAGGTRPDVVTVAPSDTVTDLLATLARHNVGAVLAVDGDAVRGVVSERDIVRRMAEDGSAVLERTVESLMTTTVMSCASGDGVDTVAQTMTDRRIRHMPVIDDGRLIGVVSIGDVVSSRIRQLEHDREQLEQYIVSG